MTSVRMLLCIGLALTLGCAKMLGDNKAREVDKEVPDSFGAYGRGGGPSVATQKQWDEFFADPDLRELIEASLKTN